MLMDDNPMRIYNYVTAKNPDMNEKLELFSRPFPDVLGHCELRMPGNIGPLNIACVVLKRVLNPEPGELPYTVLTAMPTSAKKIQEEAYLRYHLPDDWSQKTLKYAVFHLLKDDKLQAIKSQAKENA